MFWRMSTFSHSSPVDSILEKENFTLDELLDEDEIIQECKALNTRLINFLREKAQVEKLLLYIVEEPSMDADKKHILKLPFIASEIFTCEVDIILRSLVEDVELMDLLFSFIKPDHVHNTLLAGYFSKVVICLMIRKTAPFIKYIQNHIEIIGQLVDLIGITSIMEVLVRLTGADENMHSNYMDSMQWLEHVDVLDMILDKFSSSDSPEVHANATEILCAIIRCAPPVLAAKICSPSYVGRLFSHALEASRPKSVLFYALSFCICLLDPKRMVASSYQAFRSQSSHGTVVTVSQDTVEGMLGRLGDLLRLLEISSSDVILLTTYGKLQPPLGKQRLKIVEFISVLLTIGSEAVEKELVQLGAIKRVIDLFFEYPFNNFLHHHAENIIGSCLESRRIPLIEHMLHDCDIVGKILAAEKQSSLSTDSGKATVFIGKRLPPKIGNLGHITRIGNKLNQLANNNGTIKAYLQENNDWDEWHKFVLCKRNCIENVYQWVCGRPATLQDRVRDSDDDDFRDRDIDVTTLDNQHFQPRIYRYDHIEETEGSFEQDDEDAYFDDESAEVVISSLRLGDDQDSSLFTNANWFAFDNDKEVSDRITDSLASTSLNSDESDVVVLDEKKDLDEAATCSQIKVVTNTGETDATILGNSPVSKSTVEASYSSPSEGEKPQGCVEWIETSESEVLGLKSTAHIPNGELKMEEACAMEEIALDTDGHQTSSEHAETDGQVEDAKSTKTPEPANGGLSRSEVLSELPASETAAEDPEHKKTIDNSGK
ncbi:serine/threonine-protein phosphatase 6 regulatory subunit 3-like isoform X2 [Zingiber officinale]|uniref:serine/threonine-protein phosphatase 6 regulatory subunit 3-like isoform X2 n=1 Tax=Zingiber officinale TaxID=94328 RepID=UPI001C4AAB18|nr:serine/threonine-protein phosphatase 6 regulatory subunit 3-like isoform X2 [Zingiber officinale]